MGITRTLCSDTRVITDNNTISSSNMFDFVAQFEVYQIFPSGTL